MAKLTKSYGYSTGTGYLAGAGLGKRKGISEIAERLGKMLIKATKKNIQVRGNSDGLSAGGHYDGKYNFSLSVREVNDEVNRIEKENNFPIKKKGYYYSAWFEMPINPNINVKLLKEISKSSLSGFQMVESKEFKTPQIALKWLLKYGRQYCPSMRKN